MESADIFQHSCNFTILNQFHTFNKSTNAFLLIDRVRNSLLYWVIFNPIHVVVFYLERSQVILHKVIFLWIEISLDKHIFSGNSMEKKNCKIILLISDPMREQQICIWKKTPEIIQKSVNGVKLWKVAKSVHATNYSMVRKSLHEVNFIQGPKIGPCIKIIRRIKYLDIRNIILWFQDRYVNPNQDRFC